MALDATSVREVPRFTLLSEYSVYRSGEYPAVRAGFDETVYQFVVEAQVDSATDGNNDGSYEALGVSALAGRTDLVGHIVATKASDPIGVISQVSDTGTLTLASPTSVNYTGQTIGVVGLTPVGTPTYRHALGGNRWELFLNGSDPAAMARITQMLATVEVNLFMAIQAELLQLSKSDLTTITASDVTQAVQALAAKGVNVDGLLAEEGEALEEDRQAGLTPYVGVNGAAPGLVFVGDVGSIPGE